jgi:hypothetical protein
MTEGRRKLIVVGGTMAATLLVSSVALFSGKAQFAEFAAASVDLLKIGGGAFVAGNAFEHAVKAVSRRQRPGGEQ